MIFTLGRPVAAPDPRHRRVPEARIEDMLLLTGCAFEVEAGREADARSDVSQCLERCIASGLGFSLNDQGERLFDPAEVSNFVIWAGLTGRDDFWTARAVPTGRALFAELDASTPETSRFRATWRRTFDLRRFPVGSHLRLRLPLPVREAHKGKLTVTPDLAPDLRADVKTSDGRLDVRLSLGADRHVEIGALMEFGSSCDRVGDEVGNLDPDEAEVYLRPVEAPVRVTREVHALANHLAGRAGPTEAVTQFWNYLIETLGFGMVRYDDPPGPPTDCIRYGGWYDCQLGAALFVSLCRADGIPARIVSGQFLYRLAPNTHYWAEVWIDGCGWLAFDFQAWGLSLAGADGAWKDRFAGRAQPRMITQRFPFAFTGPMSVRFPPAWQMLSTKAAKGVDIAYTDIADGSLIYSDHIEVEPIA